jgi:hypothetical protein
MPLAEADVRASVHACKGEQRVRSAIVKQIFSAVQEALPSRKPLAIRYSLFAIRRRFGFNWRGVLPHDRNLNKFGCSEEQPSSLIPARPKFFGTAEPCPPEKTICYSPLAIRYSLPFYQSLIAIRYSPSFRLGRSLALPFFSSLVPRLSFRSMRRALSVVTGIDLVSRSAYK